MLFTKKSTSVFVVKVEYYKKVGGVIAALECVKGSLLKLRVQDVDYLFSSELVTDDDMRIIAGLSDVDDIIKVIKAELPKKLKGINNNKRLVGVVAGIATDMIKVLALSSRIPEKWDKEKVNKWAKAYDKAFKK